MVSKNLVNSAMIRFNQNKVMFRTSHPIPLSWKSDGTVMGWDLKGDTWQHVAVVILYFGNDVTHSAIVFNIRETN